MGVVQADLNNMKSRMQQNARYLEEMDWALLKGPRESAMRDSDSVAKKMREENAELQDKIDHAEKP